MTPACCSLTLRAHHSTKRLPCVSINTYKHTRTHAHTQLRCAISSWKGGWRQHVANYNSTKPLPCVSTTYYYSLAWTLHSHTPARTHYCAHMHTYTHSHTHACTLAHSRIHTRTHALTHTHTHTHAHTFLTYFPHPSQSIQHAHNITYMFFTFAAGKPGTMYRDVGAVIQKVVAAHGFSVVRTYCGHGVGEYVHCVCLRECMCEYKCVNAYIWVKHCVCE